MKNIHDFLSLLVGKGKTPSVQYALFDTDACIYEFTSGLKNIKSNLPIDAESTYNLFSITKTFTALAVLQLAEAGKIQLDKAVINYLPGFPYSEKITIRQLLDHTSGIPNPMPLKWTHLISEHESFNQELFFEHVFKSNSRMNSEPGTQFRYSNLGYVLLGQLIEKVSGRSFEEYISENIIRKIGLNDPHELGFRIAPLRHATGYHKRCSLSNLALGFLIDRSKFMGSKEGDWQAFHHFYPNGVAYGGLVGTSKALTRYAQVLLKREPVLLTEESKKLLFTESLVGGRATGMSLSWFKGMLKGNCYYAHAGGGGGYYTELRLYPALGVGSIIMLNRSGMRDERFLDKTDAFFITGKK